MFKDVEDKDVVWLSTIHKRKGGQADIIFILNDTLRYNGISEENVNYVGITRCQKELYFVSKGDLSVIEERHQSKNVIV